MMIIWWSSLWKTVTTCLPPLQLYCGEGYCSSPPTPPGKSFFHQGINNSYILISRLMPVIILNMFATTWVGSGFASNWTTRVYSDPGQNPGSQTDTCAMVVSRHRLWQRNVKITVMFSPPVVAALRRGGKPILTTTLIYMIMVMRGGRYCCGYCCCCCCR